MPIHEVVCPGCGFSGEIIQISSSEELTCPECGKKVDKVLSPTSSLTGKGGPSMPGPGDTGCCGSRPGEAPGCAGPGSCCGKNFGS